MAFLSTRLLLAAGVGAVALAWATFASPLPASAAEGPIKEGQPAPDISLPATQIDKVLPDKKDAKTLKLSDFKGKKNVVLYFFPKAATPG